VWREGLGAWRCAGSGSGDRRLVNGPEWSSKEYRSSSHLYKYAGASLMHGCGVEKELCMIQ
jgi:hypothetical protein